MNVRRLQTLALILSAACLLLVLVAPNSPLFYVGTMIGIILFMLGIPAIYSSQLSGWVGMADVVLLELLESRKSATTE
jgi:hypothetical protein